MTKYQIKRRFINKINKRIKTLISRTGVDADYLLDRFTGIDGVWVNGTNINIATDYFTDDLIKRIEKMVPTWSSAYQREVQDIKDYAEKSNFIGPLDLRESTVNKAIAQRFESEAAFEEDIQKYYEWEYAQDELDLAGNANVEKIRELLTDFGSAWAHGRMAEARAIVSDIKEYGVDIDAIKEW